MRRPLPCGPVLATTNHKQDGATLRGPSHPQVLVLSAALHCQNGLEKEPCSGAELGRMSQERVCSGCPHTQPLAHAGCHHPPDPPCHPSPGPLGVLHCLWIKKNLPIH